MVAASGELMSDQNTQDQEPPIQGGAAAEAGH
jgi:hypothetical protein